jgi:hypothetical protein
MIPKSRRLLGQDHAAEQMLGALLARAQARPRKSVEFFGLRDSMLRGPPDIRRDQNAGVCMPQTIASQ